MGESNNTYVGDITRICRVLNCNRNDKTEVNINKQFLLQYQNNAKKIKDFKINLIKNNLGYLLQ